MQNQNDIANRFAALLGPIRWDKVKVTKKKCLGCGTMFKTVANRVCGTCSKSALYRSSLACRSY